jgi:hypothetical protein
MPYVYGLYVENETLFFCVLSLGTLDFDFPQLRKQYVITVDDTIPLLFVFVILSQFLVLSRRNGCTCRIFYDFAQDTVSRFPPLFVTIFFSFFPSDIGKY